MTQCFETYKEYACEPSAFLHCVLTTIGSLSDGVLLSDVISHSDMSINLMTHIVSEPGSQKSNLIRVICHALSTMEIVFSSVFIKQKYEKTVGMNDDSHDYHLIVENDTKLGLTKKLAARENVYVLSDDIDMFNNSFGIYEVSDEKSIAGAKLFCQGFDGIYGDAHETGSSIFNIKRGTIRLLGTSTGDKLWTKYNF
ncbi:unnamed protein product [Adineta steineri]|uniref:Uncharacterized protein n=1 Tax=Adineta steineri TaxID=433720 RepID=A0A820CJX0_9BILA|nr:unnamed protein product [Adineta steineri]CAF4218878.1 unnamed protein product [Adineta steineri]